MNIEALVSDNEPVIRINPTNIRLRTLNLKANINTDLNVVQSHRHMLLLTHPSLPLGRPPVSARSLRLWRVSKNFLFGNSSSKAVPNLTPFQPFLTL